jgi:hypothetical protein
MGQVLADHLLALHKGGRCDRPDQEMVRHVEFVFRCVPGGRRC